MLVQGGTLYVGAGAVVDPQTTVVDAGATMTVDGTYSGTTGNDTFTVSGTVNGTRHDRSARGRRRAHDQRRRRHQRTDQSARRRRHTPRGDRVVLNFASDGTFAGGNVINFESLVKQNAGTATLTGTRRSAAARRSMAAG